MTRMPKEFIYEKRVWTLGGCVLAFIVLYFALFGMTIKNISRYQGMQKQIAAFTADISKMEFEYLKGESAINHELAVAKGFVEPTNIVIAKVDASAVAIVLKSDIK